MRCGGVSANQICISSMTKIETWEYSAGDTWHFRFKFPTSPKQVSNYAHSRECLLCQIPYSLGTDHCQIPEACWSGGRGDVDASSCTVHFTNAERSQGFAQLLQVLPTPRGLLICCCIILKGINRKFLVLGGCASLVLINSILCHY